jgi:hypothetical protein
MREVMSAVRYILRTGLPMAATAEGFSAALSENQPMAALVQPEASSNSICRTLSGELASDKLH